MEDYIKILVNSYLSDQASDKEIEALMLWISQSEENKKLFIECKRVWELTLFTAPNGRFNNIFSNEWNNLSVKLFIRILK